MINPMNRKPRVHWRRSTFKCTDCGKRVKRGLFNWAKHHLDDCVYKTTLVLSVKQKEENYTHPKYV